MNQILQMTIFVVFYLLIILVLATAYKYFQPDFDDDMAPFFLLIWPITIPMLMIGSVINSLFKLSGKIANWLKVKFPPINQNSKENGNDYR